MTYLSHGNVMRAGMTNRVKSLSAVLAGTCGGKLATDASHADAVANTFRSGHTWQHVGSRRRSKDLGRGRSYVPCLIGVLPQEREAGLSVFGDPRKGDCTDI